MVITRARGEVCDFFAFWGKVIAKKTAIGRLLGTNKRTVFYSISCTILALVRK